MTYKYFADGKSVFAKGKTGGESPHGYWEWYHKDVTLNRPGYFADGEPVGKWTTYNAEVKVYKVMER